MKVSCSQCGEELLGRVNRCWKCGFEFGVQGNSESPPTILAQPVPIAETRDDGIPVAELVAPGSDAERIAADESQMADDEEPLAPATIHSEKPPIAKRLNPTTNPFQTRVVANYPSGALQKSLATASLIASLLAIVTSFFSLLAIIPAVLGIFLANWGRSKKHYRLSIIAIVLAILAFSACVIRTVSEYRAYQQQQLDEILPPL